MAEYYLRDRCTGQIVNCVTTSKTIAEVREAYENDEYYVDNNPPPHLLRQYRFWGERP